MKYRKLMAALGIFNAIILPLYFISAYLGWYPVVEHVSGYTVWFWSFPLPDFWLALTSALMAYAIIKKRDNMAIVCGLLTASAGIFLSLNEFMFLFFTGMNNLPLKDIGFDLVSKIYYVSTGTFLIKQFSGNLSNLQHKVSPPLI